jgi:hypothetical protein
VAACRFESRASEAHVSLISGVRAHAEAWAILDQTVGPW